MLAHPLKRAHTDSCHGKDPQHLQSQASIQLFYAAYFTQGFLRLSVNFYRVQGVAQTPRYATGKCPVEEGAACLQ